MPNGPLLLEIALPVPLPRTFSYRFVPAEDQDPAAAPVVGDLCACPSGGGAE